jgi:hypothetical protein
MQSLFWLAQDRGYRIPITRRMLHLAVEAYKNSGDQTRVHDSIRDFVKKTTAWKPDETARILRKIVELIMQNKFEPPESYKTDARVGMGDVPMHSYLALTDQPYPMPSTLLEGSGRERRVVQVRKRAQIKGGRVSRPRE